MEKARKLKQKRLISELTQGMGLTYQLQNHLHSASHETSEFLLGKILSSYDKALQMLDSSVLLPAVGMQLESSTHSIAGSSPRSEVSDRDFNDQCHKDGRKKRRTLPAWTEQVCVGSRTGPGPEGPLDDRYNWRKYGQKDILGAKYPRAYYRCTHRNSQGCLAVKQVQRSDEDPSIFQVTYKGRHTCVQASQQIPILDDSLEKQVPIETIDIDLSQEEEIQKKPEETFYHIEAGPKIENEDLDNTQNIFPSFSFPFIPIESEENNFLGTFSSPFISPTTSESSYFSLSPCHFNNFEMSHHLQSSESNHTDIMSDPNSVTNSPIGDLDFSLDQVDFDPNFPFEASEIFT